MRSLFVDFPCSGSADVPLGVQGHRTHIDSHRVLRWHDEGMARRLATVMVVCSLALVGLQDAEAALFLRFDPSQAEPGQVVTASTSGESAFRPIPSRDDFPVLFVRAPARRDLGVLAVDEDGNGSATFEMPPIPSGRYEVFADCPSCSPPGIVLIGRLAVVNGVPRSEKSPQQDWVDNLAVIVMLTSAAAVATWLLLRRRTRASAGR